MQPTLRIALLLATLLSLPSCALMMFGAIDVLPDGEGPAPPMVPEIDDPGVPHSMVAGEQVTIHPLGVSFPPAELLWDFGGGAVMVATEPHYEIRALTPGTYSGSLTMTNRLGQDTQAFTYTVTAAP